jgi:hypothetical protein
MGKLYTQQQQSYHSTLAFSRIICATKLQHKVEKCKETKIICILNKLALRLYTNATLQICIVTYYAMEDAVQIGNSFSYTLTSRNYT